MHRTKRDKSGVSLEKINLDNSSLDKTNWQSASVSENYATPGWPNSQLLNNSESNKPITVEPEVFSPNFDGYNDELSIKYHLNEAGIIMNIRVYDAKGRLINQLANNFLCGTEGEFIWRGENFKNEYALNGIYLLYIEYFDQFGNVHKEKETCVLAR